MVDTLYDSDRQAGWAVQSGPPRTVAGSELPPVKTLFGLSPQGFLSSSLVIIKLSHKGDSNIRSFVPLAPTPFLDAPTITFHNHTESLPPRVGEFLNLTCSSRGFPGASSTSLRRERTNQELENVNGSQLTYFSDRLTCLDTDVYVCSSWNVWDISTQEIMVNVPCE